MDKFLHRIVALMLVPSLLLGSNMAYLGSGISKRNYLFEIRDTRFQPFANQAIIGRLTSPFFGSERASFPVRWKTALSAAALLLPVLSNNSASTLWAQEIPGLVRLDRLRGDMKGLPPVLQPDLTAFLERAATIPPSDPAGFQPLVSTLNERLEDKEFLCLATPVHGIFRLAFYHTDRNMIQEFSLYGDAERIDVEGYPMMFIAGYPIGIPAVHIPGKNTFLFVGDLSRNNRNHELLHIWFDHLPRLLHVRFIRQAVESEYASDLGTLALALRPDEELVTLARRIPDGPASDLTGFQKNTAEADQAIIQDLAGPLAPLLKSLPDQRWVARLATRNITGREARRFARIITQQVPVDTIGHEARDDYEKQIGPLFRLPAETARRGPGQKGIGVVAILGGVITAATAALAGFHYLDLHREFVRQMLAQIGPHLAAGWHALPAGSKWASGIFVGMAMVPPTFSAWVVTEDRDWFVEKRAFTRVNARMVKGIDEVTYKRNLFYDGRSGRTQYYDPLRAAFFTKHLSLKRGDRLLDFGSGSGVYGLYSVAVGAKEVLSIDKRMDCVQLAQRFVDHFGFKRRMTVRLSDGYENVERGRQFDVITFYSPMVVDKPTDDEQFYDPKGHNLDLFFGGMPEHLVITGRVALLYADNPSAITHLQYLSTKYGLRLERQIMMGGRQRQSDRDAAQGKPSWSMFIFRNNSVEVKHGTMFQLWILGAAMAAAAALAGFHYLDLHREIVRQALAQTGPHLAAWWHGLPAGSKWTTGTTGIFISMAAIPFRSLEEMVRSILPDLLQRSPVPPVIHFANVQQKSVKDALEKRFGHMRRSPRMSWLLSDVRMTTTLWETPLGDETFKVTKMAILVTLAFALRNLPFAKLLRKAGYSEINVDFSLDDQGRPIATHITASRPDDGPAPSGESQPLSAAA